MYKRNFFNNTLNFICLFTLLCLVLFNSRVVLANDLKNIRVWPAPDETRIVIDLDAKAKYSYFSLVNPNRLVVDIQNTRLKAKLPMKITDSNIVTKVRQSSAPDKSSVRLVFELKNVIVPNVFTLEPTPDGTYGHRLVIDIPNQIKAKVTPSVSKPNVQAQTPTGSRKIVVALDAGHGGEDPGAIGPTRKYEKYITLSVAKKVKAKLDRTYGMQGVLTRHSDYYVNLNKRSSIARKNKADLLVSIHADGFRKPQPRGASVWVLSTRRANNEIGRWIEKHEQQSELLGGGSVLSQNNNDQYLSHTVLDLQFSYSQKEGYQAASDILGELGKMARLHKKKPEHASLAVLKSPDIPSLLVETGFISNPTEERLLTNNAYQNKLANAIYKGIMTYFNGNPPAGTLLATQKSNQKHKVKSGESLSLIANRYGVSVSQLKASNKLKSNQVNVGQVLVIPKVKLTTAVSQSAVAKPTTKKAPPKKVSSSYVVTHKVRSGEFLSQIASKYGVSVSSIKKQNRLKSDKLLVGQKLKITTTKPQYAYHTVKKGEYLSKIASRYGVSLSQVRAANQLKSDKLLVGQKLKIPKV
ncbi:N-acetylmuramoyl-L-alanine amidase [Vibrio sp. SS-MA-C1-2]|uniref:N-acetylmuramoyl-L-alanine amidase n=1 Tax=Vibrio sp. SS-MA-C1-2 TaxID=2908646 RepID=UPI001F18786F|nr:N-acetylmuramoyl-L-alanine amidase [Vibrio sp. SS-MA-C1-2]UJF19530.1 N-acetylmuramoyl-L-alanine amidase [Vibrio sp. SS-MA-C1-2]